MIELPDRDDLDVLAAYRQILPWAEQRIAATRRDQFGASTPCSEWDVEALLTHMFSTIVYYTLLAEHAEVDTQGMVVPSIKDGDYGALYRRASAAALRAWAAPRVLDRPCRHAIAGSVSGSYALGIHAADVLIHSWDLARATGQDELMEPAPAWFALQMFHIVLAKEKSRRYLFDPQVAVPDSSDAQTRLLAFTGRLRAA
jgi:uncharacterized protein (TIGR03086 family)